MVQLWYSVTVPLDHLSTAHPQSYFAMSAASYFPPANTLSATKKHLRIATLSRIGLVTQRQSFVLPMCMRPSWLVICILWVRLTLTFLQFYTLIGTIKKFIDFPGGRSTGQ